MDSGMVSSKQQSLPKEIKVQASHHSFHYTTQAQKTPPTFALMVTLYEISKEHSPYWFLLEISLLLYNHLLSRLFCFKWLHVKLPSLTEGNTRIGTMWRNVCPKTSNLVNSSLRCLHSPTRQVAMIEVKCILPHHSQNVPCTVIASAA